MGYVISAAQPRPLSIKLCRGNLFRIKNLIKSNRQNKLKLVEVGLGVWECVYGSCDGCMGLNVCGYRWGLSRVWCVERVLVDWNSLNYRDGRRGEEKVHH